MSINKKNNNNQAQKILSVADQSVLAVRNIMAIKKQDGLRDREIISMIEKECPDAYMLHQVYQLNGFRIGR